MTPTLIIHHDSLNAIIICPKCEGTEFKETGHYFIRDSVFPTYTFKCTRCGFEGSLDKMQIKNLDQKKQEKGST
jgi:hypothetical protein